MKTNRKISGGLALISLMSAAFMIFAFASPNWLTLEGNTKGLFQFCPEDRACYSCEEAIAPWMVYSLVFDIFGVVFVFLGRSNADGKKMLMMMIFGFGIFLSYLALAYLTMSLVLFTTSTTTRYSDLRIVSDVNETMIGDNSGLNDTNLEILTNNSTFNATMEPEGSGSEEIVDEEALKLASDDQKPEGSGEDDQNDDDGKPRMLDWHYGPGYWTAWTSFTMMVIRLVFLLNKFVKLSTKSMTQLLEVEKGSGNM